MRYIAPKITTSLNAARSIESVGQSKKNPLNYPDGARPECTIGAYQADE
ncbi:MAG: hypothetical protein WA426_18350 [Silvibacterium sp.]